MKEIFFELGINLVETFISMDFITRYLGTKYNDKKKYIAFMIFWLMSFFQITVTNYITDFEIIGTYVPMAIYACYAYTSLKGSVLLKTWIAVLTHLLVVFVAIFVNLLLCNIIGYDPYKLITVFNSVRITGVIIAKTIQFYMTRLLLKNKQKNQLGRKMWITLFIIPIISVVSISLLMKASLINENVSGYVFVGVLCIVAVNIVTYYFFGIMSKEYENIIRSKLLEQQNENLKKNIIAQEAFVNEMKNVKHDIKNQLVTILNYAEDNKNENIKEYIKELINEYLPDVLNYVNTDNMALDAIINSKMALCNQEKIFMKVMISHDVKINLSQSETVILFGNLLDNAIEATKKTNDKRITINVGKKDGYVMIVIKNSIKSSVLENNENLQTSKKDKKSHGLGIKSVKNIVSKHDGMIRFYEEENMFCCQIMLDNGK